MVTPGGLAQRPLTPCEVIDTHRPEDVPLKEEAALWGFLWDEPWGGMKEGCGWARVPQNTTEALAARLSKPWASPSSEPGLP